MTILDVFGWAMMLGVGFFVGLILVLIMEVFSLGFWAMGGGLFLVLILVILGEAIAQRLTLALVGWLFRIETTDEQKADERRDRRMGRYAFALGIAAAFVAAQIWTPVDIGRLFG